MPICLAQGAKLAVIAAQAFTLSWTHTVEKTGWEEDWRLDNGKLILHTARIKGSGAGMEPPDDARLIDGWWQYHPRGVHLNEVRLANHGGVAGAWHICVAGDCRALPAGPDSPPEYVIKPCSVQPDTDRVPPPSTSAPE